MFYRIVAPAPVGIVTWSDGGIVMLFDGFLMTASSRVLTALSCASTAQKTVQN
ncbi:MAG: hypothetical protein J1E63_04835 [Muribaculaceae bacterium]|nr:hypothetical protein [Muribaculaceae bacterium]